MNDILSEMVDQLAPLVLQILGIVLLAVLSTVFAKSKQIAEAQLSATQRSLLANLAVTAVHLAEKEGLEKTGAEKAAMAAQYVNGELAAAGIKTVRFADIDATVIGAVQKAWADELGPSYHEAPAAPPAAETATPAPTAPAQLGS